VPSDESLQAAAAEVERHAQSLRGVKQGQPKLCSGCMSGAEDKRGFILEDRSDGTKMLFCGLRCIGVWAIERGWRK
jgi:hypothetical protein